MKIYKKLHKKSSKYDLLFLKNDDLCHFKIMHFPDFLTEGEAGEEKEGGKCMI